MKPSLHVMANEFQRNSSQLCLSIYNLPSDYIAMLHLIISRATLTSSRQCCAVILTNSPGGIGSMQWILSQPGDNEVYKSGSPFSQSGRNALSEHNIYYQITIVKSHFKWSALVEGVTRDRSRPSTEITVEMLRLYN